MRKTILAGIATLALVAGLLLVLRQRAPVKAEPAAAIPPSPARPEEPFHVPAPPPSAPPKTREAMVEHLRRLGRALLLRDYRSRQALDALMPPLTEQDVPWLVEQVRQGELFLALGAIDILKRAGRSEAVAALIEVLAGRGSVFLKDASAEALGTLGGPAAEAALLDALAADMDGSVRARVAVALAAFDGPHIYAALTRALSRDRDAAVRHAAAEALSKMPSQDAVRLFLEQLTLEPDPDVQIAMLAGALDRGGEALMPVLRQTVRGVPLLKAALEEEARRRGPHRYARAYSTPFFGPSVPISWNGRRIGVTVETGQIPLSDVAAALFEAPPLDRYRDFFYLRHAEEFLDDVREGVGLPRAYDSRGAPVPGGVPRNELDGTVFIHYRDPRSFATNILGYAEGRDAYVTPVSLLHEVGHALAGLGDEYSGPMASKGEAENLQSPGRPPRWSSLVQQGFLPQPIARDESFVIPGGTCAMGNRPPGNLFCPVCQLEIIARVCELTGARVPW
ncbi:MAG: HEAT repeat domain-containing protein [Planctomycetes bacterium]|nr:HEAT repeat domain-containing protein [Planctomycetota bacterium]